MRETVKWVVRIVKFSNQQSESSRKEMIVFMSCSVIVQQRANVLIFDSMGYKAI